MHNVQWDVLQFHIATGIPNGLSPAIRRPALRADLILEEAAEAAAAITGRKVMVAHALSGHPDPAKQSLPQAIDALCDLLCVTYGAACEFGIDLEPFWREVHRTNMMKRGGPVRHDGKVLKPANWQPPRIEEILEQEESVTHFRDRVIRYGGVMAP
jgi:predicted HAD superfamily Cof-like phosphohydrolase